MFKLDQSNLTFIAKTITGLEEVLAAELLKLGARDIEIMNRAVRFKGDLGTLYKTNLSLRTALRILVPIADVNATNENELYKSINILPWEEILDPEDSLAIDTVLSTQLFNHSQYVSQKAKDAIVDRFRSKFNKRPDVDLDNPTVRIHLHISNDNINIALDSSGDSLHKRGYREKTNKAPLNEVLAAGMVLLTGWDGNSNFIDLMCGSGTIVIEAAMLAANIPPGYYRNDFGFMNWNKLLPFDSQLWNTILDAAIDRISSKDLKLVGVELSGNVVKKAKENVKFARVDDIVEIVKEDAREFIPPDGNGVVIVNPPYGERMDKDNIPQLYGELGDAFKKHFSGYDCWMISSNFDALKNVGLRPSRKIKVFNGPLECRFMKYQMYKGTKKIHKINLADKS